MATKPRLKPRPDLGPQLHARPLDLPGGRSRRRLVCFSPKLNRHVVLGSYDARKLWLAIEANPAIASFCERPRRLPEAGPMIDFWVRLRSGTEEYWLLANEDVDAPRFVEARRVRTVSPEQLLAWSVPLANWERLIGIVSTWRRYRSDSLELRIVLLLGVPGTLATLAGSLPEHTADEIEAAVAHLLANGRVICPALATQAFDDSTVLRRP